MTQTELLELLAHLHDRADSKPKSHTLLILFEGAQNVSDFYTELVEDIVSETQQIEGVELALHGVEFEGGEGEFIFSIRNGLSGEAILNQLRPLFEKRPQLGNCTALIHQLNENQQNTSKFETILDFEVVESLEPPVPEGMKTSIDAKNKGCLGSILLSLVLFLILLSQF